MNHIDGSNIVLTRLVVEIWENTNFFFKITQSLNYH